MRRARTIVGLPIVSLAEGLRVGQVRDIVFDPDNRTIAALVVSEATWRHDAELIPMEHVRSFGRDAVTINSLAGLVKARGQPQLSKLLTSGVKLDGLLVMTEGGNYLGILDEMLVGPKGEMLAYEISVGFAEDVNHGKCLLPADEALTVGRDVATFPDGVERLASQPLPDVELEPAQALPAGEVRALQPVKPATA
jgi:uncharacterized protein YrrD